ncbi:triphosphoribosyl-dephospho-CoA synthase [Cytobacillus oceanisediminis]|uniref:triphosphoribosyl-dephospho-CoA synthase n=1 Tax=Cytobacillus oceanisediminis TaxID=665099 RepID=A0A2V2ZXD1_9BACI|nr:triphosphoribosyl-dephospho-CoA synthase [Cytobacillus oceanisediminis]PWW28340.1 triphosphoribosyl-dephospho-CoA synthase [Cytobacillus oceanisediminis]
MSRRLNSEAGKETEVIKMKDLQTYSFNLGKLAVQSLIEEAELTPKPGLVDQNNSGSHTDMSLKTMIKSAKALETTFREIAETSLNRIPSQQLREEIAVIGRRGEQAMFKATGGVNTHKGAIWALGLLVSSAAMDLGKSGIEEIAIQAGSLALFTDRNLPAVKTNGSFVKARFGVNGAKGEAEQGFPHVRHFGLPILYESRKRCMNENLCRLNVLIALMAELNDTCILHRGGAKALSSTKKRAKEILKAGGVSTAKGWQLLKQLDQSLCLQKVSPGGSADLLAATIFMDFLDQNAKSEFKRQGALLI